MIASDIAKRYAKALFDIASEEQGLEKFGAQLDSICEVIANNPELRKFLLDPIFDDDQKKTVLGGISKRIGLSPVVDNFLKLLVDKNRIGILSEIQESYRQMSDEVLNNIRVHAKTAFPLTDGLEKKLVDRLSEITSKNVLMALEEDAFLLGGVVVTIGDTRYDGSIRTQLDNIRNLLGEETY